MGEELIPTICSLSFTPFENSIRKQMLVLLGSICYILYQLVSYIFLMLFHQILLKVPTSLRKHYLIAKVPLLLTQLFMEFMASLGLYKDPGVGVGRVKAKEISLHVARNRLWCMSPNPFVQLCLFSQNKCLGWEWNLKTIVWSFLLKDYPHSALGPHSLEKQIGGPHTHTLGHFQSPVTICHWTIGHCSSALPVITKYVMGPINANSFCNPEPSQDSWMFLNILQFILSGPGDWRKSAWRAFMDPEETGMEDSRVFFWSPFGFIRTVLWKKYDFLQSPGGLMGQ